MKNNYHKDTASIRIQIPKSEQREHASPIHMTSSFVFDNADHAIGLFSNEISGNIYSRYGNPNVTEFIEKMCILEGADAGFATASGMAAVFSSLAALLNSGDHIICTRSVFGSTHQLLNYVLPKWGISYTYVDVGEEDWESALQSNTKILFLETPSNPGLQIVDIEKAANFAIQNGLTSIVDNCFATPILQCPLDYGIDLVTHSATKYIDGQGRGIGGIILGKEKYIKEITAFCRHTGPSMSPFNAWMFSKSLETLSIRMKHHCESALSVAQSLLSHSKIENVKYPFLDSHPQYQLAKKQMKAGGGLLSFRIKGGLQKSKTFLNNLRLLSLSSNLGDTRTIVTHPASTTHSKLSEAERNAVEIFPNLIRMSVGLEHVEDILTDVFESLKHV